MTAVHGAAVSTEELLRDAVSVLLPGAPDHIPFPDEVNVSEFLDMARANGVLGPLLFSLPDSADDLREQVVAAYEPVLLWCMELELRLLEIKQWFDDAGGIDFRVLKGPAVTHLDEVDPSLRTFADLDLLIHTRDMDRAIEVLTAHGVTRRIPQRRPGFDRRFVKGVGMRCDDGIEIDIHRTLCVGALGFRIPLDDLFADPEYFEVGAERFPTMKLEHRALHAAYHAVMGTTVPPLKTLRDLGGYLTDPRLGPDVLVPVAQQWGGETVLGEAVRVTLRTLSIDNPAWHAWLDRFTPDETDLDLIDHSRAEVRWPIGRGVLRELDWRGRAAFIWALAVPSRESLRDNERSRIGQIRSRAQAIMRRR